MIRDITIGQYYPSASSIHKLDPRTKIIGVFAYIISLFFIKYFIGYVFVAVSLYALIRASKVPLSYMLKGLKSIGFILAFTMILNLFFTTNGNEIFSFWIFRVTDQGIIMAIKLGVRLVLLIVGSSLLTLTTSPIELTDGIERLLKPFSKIGIPAHEIAMMMSISLRFIPILIEETDKIMKAQLARGADFETGNIIRRAKAMVPILIPLFISAFRRADELAMAMEARCYRGGVGRTRLKSLTYSRNDVIAFVVMIVFLALSIFVL